MFKMITIAALSITVLIASASRCNAVEEMDVDLADSLDFESFHKPKDSTIKVYDSESGEFFSRAKTAATKTYQQQTSSTEPTKTNDSLPSLAGKRFEIRQRYTLSFSDQTSDTAVTAINTLHKKMATHCPRGWLRQKEWSTPIEQDFYLHYAFECID